jgi:hypothetical protein
MALMVWMRRMSLTAMRVSDLGGFRWSRRSCFSAANVFLGGFWRRCTLQKVHRTHGFRCGKWERGLSPQDWTRLVCATIRLLSEPD